MNKKIVTAFSREGYFEYGHRFLNTYVAPFPLEVYSSGFAESVGFDTPSGRAVHLHQSNIDGFNSFLARWANEPKAIGKAGPKFKPGELVNGYCYRYDAHKFCRMVFTMWDAARRMSEQGGGLMMWLDGDSILRRGLPADMFEKFLPSDCDYAYLGRGNKHTETGFLIFRLPQMMPILDAWVSYYKDDTWQEEKEWHSAYLFDRAREQFPHIKGNDLTPGKSGHVIHQCEVGKYIDHLKGNRKHMRRSPEAK